MARVGEAIREVAHIPNAFNSAHSVGVTASDVRLLRKHPSVQYPAGSSLERESLAQIAVPAQVYDQGRVAFPSRRARPLGIHNPERDKM